MSASLHDERERILREYRRRRAAHEEDRYEPWAPGAALARSTRVRDAAQLLHRAGMFPRAGDRVLEIGFGLGGWLPDLIAFGVREADIAGVDLDEHHVAHVQDLLPSADLRRADASALPFADARFRIVVASTLFTSILAQEMRAAVAREIVRVLEPGGALLWYDFAYDNPRNANVKGINRRELARLFPSLDANVRPTTLAPPLARAIAPLSWTAATMLEAIPFLRTHLVGVLRKSRAP